MKRILLALVAAVAVTAPALADEALSKANKCSMCHAVDKTKSGPSYKAIAAKHAADKDAVAKMTAITMKGGKGSFGTVEMPAQPNVSEADAKKLAAWIMSLK